MTCIDFGASARLNPRAQSCLTTGTKINHVDFKERVKNQYKNMIKINLFKLNDSIIET